MSLGSLANVNVSLFAEARPHPVTLADAMFIRRQKCSPRPLACSQRANISGELADKRRRTRAGQSVPGQPWVLPCRALLPSVSGGRLFSDPLSPSKMSWHRGGAASLLASLCIIVSFPEALMLQGRHPTLIQFYDLSVRVSKLEPRVDDLEEGLEPRVDDIQSTLQEFVARMDTLVSKMDTQQTQLASQQTQLDSLQAKLDSQHTQLDSLQTKLDSQQTQLDSQQTQLDTQQTELDTQQTHVTELTARLDEQNQHLDESTSEINRQEAQLQEVNVEVNGQKSQMDEITTKVDNQTSRLESLTTRLGAQESQVAGLVTDFDSQRTQLVLLNDTLNIERSRLDGAANETASQETQIAELAVRLDQVEQITIFRDCSDLPAWSTTGKYPLRPGLGHSLSIVEAFCDMDTDGGGWTVFQRRDDIKPRQDFFLGWTDYKHGFGSLTGEFWWGLNYLWQLTSAQDRRYELRVDLEDFAGNTAHAVYQGFWISSEEDGYRLSASNYSGDAGDSLGYNVNRPFTTRDRDQDSWSRVSCAERWQGAWWYGFCSLSHLNGRYLEMGGGGENDRTGIYWLTWKKGYESLKKTEMKIRPT